MTVTGIALAILILIVIGVAAYAIVIWNILRKFEGDA